MKTDSFPSENNIGSAFDGGVMYKANTVRQQRSNFTDNSKVALTIFIHKSQFGVADNNP